MENKSIVLSIRFKGDPDRIKTMLFLNELVNLYLDKSVKELNYTITDKSTNNWKQKSKTILFKSNNLPKITEIFTSSKRENIYVGFELLTPQGNYAVKSRDIDVSASYNELGIIRSINFIIDGLINLKIGWLDFIKKIVNFLMDQDCKVVYGFLFSLANSKLPIFYIEGIGNDKISIEEHKKLDIWSSKKDFCDNKIWDIFWGNLFTLNKDTDPKFIEEISEIVGQQSVDLLSDNLIWVNLTGNVINFEIDKENHLREKLYSYMREKNRLLGE